MSTCIAHTIAETRQRVSEARRSGRSIGFVPTMGALHAGHGDLIAKAAARRAFTVVSIFVNPTQFGPNEDYSRYPRTLEADRVLCEQFGADLIFAPDAAEMYPAPFTSHVEVASLTDVLCGPSRPGHFRGVATVVMKLFQIVLPDFAVFGQKDAQQALVIQRMVRDLNVPIELIIAPTVREHDGLAMSSRNRYLSPKDRANAPRIYAALLRLRELVRNGETDVLRLEGELHHDLETIPDARVDYARILHAETLEPIARLTDRALAAVAVFLGTTRLIDNIFLTPADRESS